MVDSLARSVVQHSSHWGAYRAIVEDGRLQRAEPFPADRDPSPLLASVPGAVHARNRVLRPAVRRSWLEAGGGAPDAGRVRRRGTESFVEVEWDEALDLVAAELRRTYQSSGPSAIFGGSYGWSSAGRLHHAKTQLNHFLACCGGYTGHISNYSFGAADAILPHVLGDATSATGEVATWDEIAANSGTLVMFGGFPAKNVQLEPGGAGSHEARLGLRRALDAGIRLINVNPVRGDAPDHPGVRWLPIRPGTDVALILSLTQGLVRAGRADTAFLERCTVGFDRFAGYLDGSVDGVVKDAGWAAAITGVPAADITALSEELGSPEVGRVLLTATWALQRARYGEQPYWAIVALAAALGQIGLPGGGFGFGYGCVAGFGSGTRRYGTPAFRARRNPVGSAIPVARIADMLLDPGGHYEFGGSTRTYPAIEVVYWAGGNPFHHHQDLNRLVEAWQRPRTVVVNEPWWTPTAQLADIVLPATTTLERDDIGAGSKDPYVVAMKQGLEPPGQARNDRWIFTQLARRLGVEQLYTSGQSDQEALVAMYETARCSAAEHGHEMPDFDAFWAAGSFRHLTQAPRPPFSTFRADPAGQPLRTPSGRIEIFSATIDAYGYDDCPGHPSWLGLDRGPRSSEAATFPIHLLSPQPATRLHSQLDMAQVSREAKVAGREPCIMNAADAAARGIGDGDLIRLWNERGEVYAGARLSGELIEGVALLATGAWYTPAELGRAGSPDLHGNVNVLSRDVGTSRLAQAASAQTLFVQIERAATDAPWRDPFAVPAMVGRETHVPR